jgi:hypothetical protein
MKLCHEMVWSLFGGHVYALQMKGWWESNINVWYIQRNETAQSCYFQNRIIMFCLPVLTLIYLWEISIFPRSICLFCCRKYVLILGIYKIKLLTDTWTWKLGLRPRYFQKRKDIAVAVHARYWQQQNRGLFRFSNPCQKKNYCLTSC